MLVFTINLWRRWVQFATNVSETADLSKASFTKLIGAAFAGSFHNNISGFSPQAIFAGGILDTFPGVLITTYGSRSGFILHHSFLPKDFPALIQRLFLHWVWSYFTGFDDEELHPRKHHRVPTRRQRYFCTRFGVYLRRDEQCIFSYATSDSLIAIGMSCRSVPGT